MSFVPPYFSKFGKNLSDLLKKKFDFKNQITVNTQVDPTLKFETKVSTSERDQLDGSVKINHDNSSLGYEIEGNVNSNGSTDVEVKYKNLYPGLLITSKVDCEKSSISAEYSTKHLASSLKFNYGTKKSKGEEKSGDTVFTIEDSLVLGAENVAVGGSVVYDVSSRKITDYNVGLQYQPAKEAFVTLQTSNSAEDITASFIAPIENRKGLQTRIGAQLVTKLTSFENVQMTLAGDHQFDANNQIRGKIDNRGVLASVFEHRLDNPSISVALAAEWNVLKRQTRPDRFGIGLTFPSK